MKKIQHDFSKLLEKKHEGKWVAISSDYKKILGYSDSLAQLQKKIVNIKAVYTKVLPSHATFAF